MVNNRNYRITRTNWMKLLIMTLRSWQLCPNQIFVGSWKIIFKGKHDQIRFSNAIAILESRGNKLISRINEKQFKPCTMSDKVKLLVISHLQNKSSEMYNEIVKCLFKESFPLMEVNKFWNMQNLWHRNFKKNRIWE